MNFPCKHTQTPLLQCLGEKSPTTVTGCIMTDPCHSSHRAPCMLRAHLQKPDPTARPQAPLLSPHGPEVPESGQALTPGQARCTALTEQGQQHQAAQRPARRAPKRVAPPGREPSLPQR